MRRLTNATSVEFEGVDVTEDKQVLSFSDIYFYLWGLMLRSLARFAASMELRMAATIQGCLTVVNILGLVRNSNGGASFICRVRGKGIPCLIKQWVSIVDDAVDRPLSTIVRGERYDKAAAKNRN
ncbi:uncharacterized protein BDCG_01234 [Blastomyces dermatitidis ER-3]|uniref:Uncharacterized protein n=1 Tax=Ajellomyces dermatitidis (strain ER-3 / ATCC MYA-2586) TaxID=559297 RepID=A0ABP2ENH6_AJEDR|nr:uncharacterized protein BDCG_01234 [Blastomyces dermatitidis ER-3]EEQ84429.2 hypothetical protein BDCG_01234 [Blastomyces dermatitidis ER-3]